MSENLIRHLIALFTTLVAVFIWLSGYFSGTREWWWTGIGVLLIYAIVYKLVEA